MVLYIPTTWLENLGRARRVSFYNFDSVKVSSHPELWKYTVQCDIELPNGTTERESEFMLSRTPKSWVSRRYSLKNEIREKIREKYPKK